MAMIDGGVASVASSNSRNERGQRRRKNNRRSIGSLGGLLGSGSSSTLSTRRDGMEDNSSSLSSSFGELMSRSMSGFRSRAIDEDVVIAPFGGDRANTKGNSSGTGKEGNFIRKKPTKSRSGLTMPSLQRAVSLQASDAFSANQKQEKEDRREEVLRATPGRSKSGSMLRRASQAIRPTRRSSPPPSAFDRVPSITTDIPELESFDERPTRRKVAMHRSKTMSSTPQEESTSVPKPSLRRCQTEATTPPTRSRQIRGRSGKKTVTLSISPIRSRNSSFSSRSRDGSRSRESSASCSRSPKRSMSPFRRTRSAVDTPSILRNAQGVNFDDYSDSESDRTSFSGSPKRSRSPMRKSMSGVVLSSTANRQGKLAKGTITKADLAPRIPLGRGNFTRGDSAKSLLPRPGSSAALVGRGVRATKSACSDLAAMQLALGRSGAKLAVNATKQGISGGGAAILGGLRATKSACADLADMQKALGVSNSRGRSTPLEDPLFVEMTQWNPMDADDRAKYDDVAVKRHIRRNPDALKAIYYTRVGRSGVCRSALSTIVALGASLETVRAAIKAHPAALRGTRSIRSTPLHTACSFNTDMLVVRYIYHKYPEAIKATTKHVFLPLHNACLLGSPSMEMIQFLIEAYPDGLTEINKLGDTPLRTAERNDNMPQEILEYLEEETERVFGQNSANENKRKAIQARQSWGSSKGLLMEALCNDETDHTTISTALLDLDQSDNSTSEEFAHDVCTHHHMSLPDLPQETSDQKSDCPLAA